jgi:hypothetical protein
MPPLHLTHAEQLKTLIVDPVINALRLEMRQAVTPIVSDLKTLHEKQSGHDQQIQQLSARVAAIEKFKAKIAAICSAIAILAGVVWRMLLDWLRSHLPVKLH